MNLYSKNIQPVWVQAENRSDESLYLTPMGLDSGYFTPRETANRSRTNITKSQTQEFEQVVARLLVANFDPRRLLRISPVSAHRPSTLKLIWSVPSSTDM